MRQAVDVGLDEIALESEGDQRQQRHGKPQPRIRPSSRGGDNLSVLSNRTPHGNSLVRQCDLTQSLMVVQCTTRRDYPPHDSYRSIAGGPVKPSGGPQRQRMDVAEFLTQHVYANESQQRRMGAPANVVGRTRIIRTPMGGRHGICGDFGY
jgi:hypothetical protein